MTVFSTIGVNPLSGGVREYIWTITGGTSKMTFENNSSTVTKTNTNTVGITSTSYSAQLNDVTVQLRFTPTGGSQVTASHSLNIDSPYKLLSLGLTTNRGIAASGSQACTAMQPGSDGFVSLVPYAFRVFSVFKSPINTSTRPLPTNKTYIPGIIGPRTDAGGYFVFAACATS